MQTQPSNPAQIALTAETNRNIAAASFLSELDFNANLKIFKTSATMSQKKQKSHPDKTNLTLAITKAAANLATNHANITLPNNIQPGSPPTKSMFRQYQQQVNASLMVSRNKNIKSQMQESRSYISNMNNNHQHNNNQTNNMGAATGLTFGDGALI